MAWLNVVRQRDWFLLVIAVVPPLLLFPKLDAACLWQDEAETALLARCILIHGYPLAHDGHRIISDQPGQVDLNDDGVWIWTSWFHNYVAAASFAVFGESTWSARLPFVLIGWGAILLSYRVFRSMTRDRLLSRLATVLLILSVPFLLHARQCRYYTLLTFFTMLHAWGYLRLVRTERRRFLMFVVGGVGLYYSFFPQLFASMIAMGVHLLFRHRNARATVRFGCGAICIAAFTLPFFIYTRSWARDYENIGHGFDSLPRYLSCIRAYLAHVHVYCWPFALALPLAWRFGSGWRSLRRWVIGLAATTWLIVWLAAETAPASAVSFGAVCVTVVLLAAAGLWWLRASSVSARGVEAAERDEWVSLVALLLGVTVLLSAAVCPFPFFRYLVGVLPLFALATAGTVLAVTYRRWWAAFPLTVLLVGSDAVHYTPLYAAATQTLIAGGRALHSQAAIKSYMDTGIKYGHVPTNGVTLTVLLKSGRGPHWFYIEYPLSNYFRELTHDYEGPVEGVIRYLAEHARPEDTVVTSYEHFPLLFYTDLNIEREYTPDAGKGRPEWLFLHSARSVQLLAAVERAGDVSKYERAPVHAHELDWDNIPEPYWHRFVTPKDRKKVVLVKLREQFRRPR